MSLWFILTKRVNFLSYYAIFKIVIYLFFFLLTHTSGNSQLCVTQIFQQSYNKFTHVFFDVCFFGMQYCKEKSTSFKDIFCECGFPIRQEKRLKEAEINLPKCTQRNGWLRQESHFPHYSISRCFTSCTLQYFTRCSNSFL